MFCLPRKVSFFIVAFVEKLASDVAQERQHVEMLTGIENFSADQLKHADCHEKHVLPSPDGQFIRF